MAAWVLIVTVWIYGSNGGNAVAMQEFTNKERCEAAQAVVRASRNADYFNVQAVCVLK